MIEIVRQEILKIRRRRGLFWSAIGLTFLVPVIIVVVDLVLRDARPGSYVAGVELLDATAGSVAVLSLVLAILIGAIAGSWDVQHGTFRYLCLTGTPRRTLYWARVPALVVVIVVVALPGTLVAAISSFLLPLEGDVRPTAGDVGSAVWTIVAGAWVYGLIALAVGALLTSSAAAIAISLALNFIGLPLLSLVDRVSEPLGNVMLPTAFSRLVGDADDPALAVAVVAVVVWVAAFLAAGAFRATRAEY